MVKVHVLPVKGGKTGLLPPKRKDKGKVFLNIFVSFSYTAGLSLLMGLGGLLSNTKQI